MDPTDSTSGTIAGQADPASVLSVVDARPILRRTEDNLWDRTERLRSQLYHLIEATCLKLGFEALVLQSDPYDHPAWVKVESWKPEREGALTARSSMTVSITAMPYHLYEAVYRVEWEKQGRQGASDHLYAFREHEVDRMLRFLVKSPDVPIFGSGEAKWILGSVQLRTEWWQFWKPRNKVAALRPDFARGGSAALLAVGSVMTLGGLASTTDEPGDYGYGEAVFDTTAVAVDTSTVPYFLDTMGSTAVPTDTVALTAPLDTLMAPAVDVSGGWLSAGQEATGYLGNANDQKFADTQAPYAEWRYYAPAGERIAVTMRSNAFEPFLVLGQVRDQQWTTLATPDSAYVGGPESRVEVVLPAGGEYVIAAGSRYPAQTGSYTILVDRLGS
ncbi:MAG TPA: hypothetical protein VFR81_18670 [Longimicrobium sp.]|nr:hypothetical protein [Longimicrobium sp.]